MHPSPFELLLREEKPGNHRSPRRCQSRKENAKKIRRNTGHCLQEGNYPPTINYAHSSAVQLVVLDPSHQLKRCVSSPFEQLFGDRTHQRQQKRPHQDIVSDQTSPFHAFLNEEAHSNSKPSKRRRLDTQVSKYSTSSNKYRPFKEDTMGPTQQLLAKPEKQNSSDFMNARYQQRSQATKAKDPKQPVNCGLASQNQIDSVAKEVDLHPVHSSQLHSSHTRKISKFSEALFKLTAAKYKQTKKKMDAQPYQGSDYERLLPKSPLFENDLNRGLIRHTVKDQPNERREVPFRRRQKRKLPLYRRFILQRTLYRIEDQMATTQSSSMQFWLAEWQPRIKETL